MKPVSSTTDLSDEGRVLKRACWKWFETKLGREKNRAARTVIY